MKPSNVFVLFYIIFFNLAFCSLFAQVQNTFLGLTKAQIIHKLGSPDRYDECGKILTYYKRPGFDADYFSFYYSVCKGFDAPCKRVDSFWNYDDIDEAMLVYEMGVSKLKQEMIIKDSYGKGVVPGYLCSTLFIDRGNEQPHYIILCIEINGQNYDLRMSAR